jgi:hypothetical protein
VTFHHTSFFSSQHIGNIVILAIERAQIQPTGLTIHLFSLTIDHHRLGSPLFDLIGKPTFPFHVDIPVDWFIVSLRQSHVMDDKVSEPLGQHGGLTVYPVVLGVKSNI